MNRLAPPDCGGPLFDDGSLERPDDDELRALFAATAPRLRRSRAADIVAAAATAAPRSAAQPWLNAAAAVLILTCGIGFGWTASSARSGAASAPFATEAICCSRCHTSEQMEAHHAAGAIPLLQAER